MNSTSIQAFVDGLSAQWQRERAGSQMTLGKLIDRLSTLPADKPINELKNPHSYRGYYCDLAFETGVNKIPVAEALALCRSAMGEVLEGYKGGDFQMGRNTPVWLANYGCTGQKLLGLNEDGSLRLGNDGED